MDKIQNIVVGDEVRGSVRYHLFPPDNEIADGEDPVITGTITVRGPEKQPIGIVHLAEEGIAVKYDNTPFIPIIAQDKPFVLKHSEMGNFKIALFDALCQQPVDTLLDLQATISLIATRFSQSDRLTSYHANTKPNSIKQKRQQINISCPDVTGFYHSEMHIKRNRLTVDGMEFCGEMDLRKNVERDGKIVTVPFAHFSIMPGSVQMKLYDIDHKYGDNPFELPLDDDVAPLRDDQHLGQMLQFLAADIVSKPEPEKRALDFFNNITFHHDTCIEMAELEKWAHFL